jgi:hypothetical protein
MVLVLQKHLISCYDVSFLQTVSLFLSIFSQLRASVVLKSNQKSFLNCLVQQYASVCFEMFSCVFWKNDKLWLRCVICSFFCYYSVCIRQKTALMCRCRLLLIHVPHICVRSRGWYQSGGFMDSKGRSEASIMQMGQLTCTVGDWSEWRFETVHPRSPPQVRGF